MAMHCKLIAKRVDSSYAYPGQLHTRQNRRSRDYGLAWDSKRPEKGVLRIFRVYNLNEPNEGHIFHVI